MTDPNTPPALLAPIRKRHRKSSRIGRLGKRLRKSVKLLIIICIGVILITVVSALVLITDANNRVNTSLTSFGRVINLMQNKPSVEWTITDFHRLQTGVDDLNHNLSSARTQITFLRPFASLNTDLSVTLGVLDAAFELSIAAEETLTGLEPTLAFLTSGNEQETVASNISSGARVVELLDIGYGRFTEASKHLEAAQSIIDSWNQAAVSPSVLLRIEGLIQYYEQIENISRLTLAAPDLLTTALGLTEDKSYLILAQNNDEIRPSGGYISTFGWISVRNGQINEYGYSPTTETSPNPPSASITSDLDIPDWWIQLENPLYAAWDSSWYADFPSTADMARLYYDGGANPESPVDGVIAIDVTGFEYILTALNSVTVPGYDVTVTPENFRQTIYDIRASREQDIPHKRFLAALYQAIFDDWQRLGNDPQINSNLLSAIFRALQEKHIMLYLSDKELNETINLLAWSGSQAHATNHDFLMVADANIGANKVNRSVLRHLIYDVEIQSDGSLQSRLTVNYDYPASLADNDPAIDPLHHGPLEYENLMQVFLPVSSSINETKNLQSKLWVIPENSSTILASRISLLYNTTESFQFSYATGTVVEIFGPYRRYRLHLQKQPGSAGDIVNVQILLPPDADVLTSSPELAASYFLDQPVLEFEVQLLVDQWIEVIYRSTDVQ
jgi:hypothetical protein